MQTLTSLLKYYTGIIELVRSLLVFLQDLVLAHLVVLYYLIL